MGPVGRYNTIEYNHVINVDMMGIMLMDSDSTHP